VLTARAQHAARQPHIIMMSSSQHQHGGGLNGRVITTTAIGGRRLRQLATALMGDGGIGAVKQVVHSSPVAAAQHHQREEDEGVHILSPAQRLQVETKGYIIVQNALTTAKTTRLRDDIYALEAGWQAKGDIPSDVDPNYFSWLTSNSPDFWRIDNISHLGQSFLEYTTHPALTAIVEEMIGVKIRLEQSDAHIRRQQVGPPADARRPARPGFHAGPHTSGVGPYGRHSAQDWYRFAYVKTLTNLTDLRGPEDGGTLVIPV
jgi:hypothetical protein